MVAESLSRIYEGWEGYNTSLKHAIEPLTPEQLAFRPAPGMYSVGEVAGHLAIGRIDWFHRMDAPGSADLVRRASGIQLPGGRVSGAITEEPTALIGWLDATWDMIERTLNAWTVDDLWKTYNHTYQGVTYAVSRQWTLWRIMAHDIQHGGQLTVMLGMQAIEPPELAWLGGHLTEPPVAG